MEVTSRQIRDFKLDGHVRTLVNKMESESSYALPSPTDTLYRTPSSSRSRITSRTYEDTSPQTTPPPVHTEEQDPARRRKRGSCESVSTVDESLPLSDPRRFTPTLHASLVSEILSLRRDLEARTSDVDRLEQRYHDAQLQNESLNNQLLAANRDTRQVKRQMHILEGGTLSAIDELAKERDEARQTINDLRALIDDSQRDAKHNETRVYEVQERWQKDQQMWNDEKRSLEHKIHVAEGRLRVVLGEVAKLQLHSSEQSHEPPRRSQSRQSLTDSPRKQKPSSYGNRRQSMNSNASDQLNGRSSVMSFTHANATNLADELDLENIEEDYASQPDEPEPRSAEYKLDENTRPGSRISLKARKILGMPIDLNDLENRSRLGEFHADSADDLDLFTSARLPYVDSASQYSRPASPSKAFRLSGYGSTPVPRSRFSTDTARFSRALSVTSPTSVAFSNDTCDNAWEESLHNRPIMVSSACQTLEQLPSIPIVPSEEKGTTLEPIVETVETREIAVQTEFMSAGVSATHKRTDTITSTGSDLLIPSITIVPPTSRPMTPEDTSVKLPPRTKSASCQVETHALCHYNSVSMQTEDIRIDKRNLAPPHPLVPPPPVPNPVLLRSAKLVSVPRRSMPTAANSSMRRTVSAQVLPPINDDGPLSDASRTEMARPVRSSSMFAGFDDLDSVDAEEDVFQDEEFYNRPTTRLILSHGKLVTSSQPLDNIEESGAVAAGKRMALSNITLSEDGVSSEPPHLDRDDEELEYAKTRRPPPMKQVKRVASAQSGNLRKTALVSSGTSVHASKNSLSSLASNDTLKGPPVSIPVRYSSARVGKSASDGGRRSRGSSNTSPTRHVRKARKSSLRKTRSGPAISPSGRTATSRARSRTPPIDNRVSIVPDMPQFYMPESQSQGPVPSNYAASYEPNPPQSSIITSAHPESVKIEEPSSDRLAVQQTTVVDAIAQTMIGEWMFKYVRRRKSFGKPEKEWDLNKSVDELSNGGSNGVRHKRWVWLAPYERCVMWSNKQPVDGTSLLGKSGRKLQIKSVLDVKDDNPLPKGAVVGPHFQRSILVLTPQRALKFTAATQERHYIWLTALSFLSHSPVSLNDLAPPPPISALDTRTIHSTSPTGSMAGSLRRRPIRDSIRIAKNPGRQPPLRSFTTGGIPMTAFPPSTTNEQYDPVNDAALPPTIRRYHNRNRSNTAPKPPTTLRTFLAGSNHTPPLVPPRFVEAPRHLSNTPAYAPSIVAPSVAPSRRASEASATIRPSVPPSQFFDSAGNSSHAASMTMRMDAFMGERQNQIPRGPLRNLRLAHSNLARGPSVRNLREMNSWAEEEREKARKFNNESVMSANTMGLGSGLTTPTEVRFSESTIRSEDLR